jgi:DNA-directed RNA polymerase subunit RPC12/RpoP
MKCTHCSRSLVFASRSDRGSGQQVDVYSCIYCGAEMREYRPNRQIGRS